MAAPVSYVPMGMRLPRRLAGERRVRRRSAALAQEVAQPVQRPGVDDVVAGEPAALRGADPVPHVLQVPGGVGVAVDRELHPEPLGPQDVVVLQVDPVAKGIDLARGTGARARLEDRVEVGVDRRAFRWPVTVVGGLADDCSVVRSDGVYK